ncbi:MAG: hypothetical protein R3D60_03170 [Paracoccaceae bacterium]
MMTIQRPTRFLLALGLASATPLAPALADVSHSYGGRFGVSYQRDPNAAPGTTSVLYEGRYTTTFSHQTDNGLRFRFQVDLSVGNLAPRRPDDPSIRPSGTVSLSSD